MASLLTCLREPVRSERLPTTIAAVDAAVEGFPHGAISELAGGASCGKTSLLLALLAQSTRQGAVCALVDTTDSFDPASGAASGIDLHKLIWVRCAGNAEHAVRTADLLLQGGGFGVIALDLSDATTRALNRIPTSFWFRCRRALSNTSTILCLLGRQPLAGSCSALVLELSPARPDWSGSSKCSRLLAGAHLETVSRKPPRPSRAIWQARRLG